MSDTAEVQPVVTKALERALQILRNEAVVHMEDIVAALRIMIPHVEPDAASVETQLSHLVGNGYQLPFKIIGCHLHTEKVRLACPAAGQHLSTVTPQSSGDCNAVIEWH